MTGALETSTPGAAAGPVRRQGPGRVLGTFLVLVIILLGVLALVQALFVGTLDGSAKQREYFGEKPPQIGRAHV